MRLKCPKILSLTECLLRPQAASEERRAVREAIYESNERDFPTNLCFVLMDGKIHLLASVDHKLINEDINQCDYFLLLLWDRWECSPGRRCQLHVGHRRRICPRIRTAGEFGESDATNCCALQRCQRKTAKRPGGQLEKVLRFKKAAGEAEKKLLFGTFDTVERIRETAP